MKKICYYLILVIIIVLLSGCYWYKQNAINDNPFFYGKNARLQDSISSFIDDIGSTKILYDYKTGVSIVFDADGDDTTVTFSTSLFQEREYAMFPDFSSRETIVYYFNFNPSDVFSNLARFKDARMTIQKWKAEIDDEEGYFNQNWPYSIRKYKYWPSEDSLELLQKKVGKFEACRNEYATVSYLCSIHNYSKHEIEQVLSIMTGDKLEHEDYFVYKTNEILFNCLYFKTFKFVKLFTSLNPENQQYIYKSLSDGPYKVEQFKYLPRIRRRLQIAQLFGSDTCRELLKVLPRRITVDIETSEVSILR